MILLPLVQNLEALRAASHALLVPPRYQARHVASCTASIPAWLAVLSITAAGLLAGLEWQDRQLELLLHSAPASQEP